MRQYLPNIDDFQDAPDPLVNGDYQFHTSRHELKTAKDSRQFYKISGELVSGPAFTKPDGTQAEYSGRPFSFNLWIPNRELEKYPESTERTFKQFLTAGNVPWDEQGYDDDDFDELDIGITLGDQKNSDYKEVKRFFALA